MPNNAWLTTQHHISFINTVKHIPCVMNRTYFFLERDKINPCFCKPNTSHDWCNNTNISSNITTIPAQNVVFAWLIYHTLVQECNNWLNLALCNLTSCCSWFLRYDLSLSSNSFSQRTLIKFAISSKWKSFPPNYRWWKILPLCLSRKITSIIVCWVVEWVSNYFAVSFCVLFSSTGNIFNLYYS